MREEVLVNFSKVWVFFLGGGNLGRSGGVFKSSFEINVGSDVIVGYGKKSDGR